MESIVTRSKVNWWKIDDRDLKDFITFLREQKDQWSLNLANKLEEDAKKRGIKL